VHSFLKRRVSVGFSFT